MNFSFSRSLKSFGSATGTFAAFRHTNFRIWSAGNFISAMGMWIQSTAQGYLIYELTQSSAYLGYISFASGIPILFLTLFGGVIADRVPRRTLLMITQSLFMTSALTLATLIFTGLIQPWHVLIASFFLGIVNAFDAPTRQVFVVELVGNEDLTNAIALNATIFNTATVLGPSIGGIVYAVAGPAWCFTFNGLSYLAILAVLSLLRLEPREKVARKGSAIAELSEGLRFARTQEPVRTLLLNLGFVILFGFSLMTLIPAWAVNVLGGDVKTNGLLLSARGVGALIGALMIASLGSRKIRGKLITLASITLPLTMLIFSISSWIPVSVLAMAGIGWSLIMSTNVSNALVQTSVPEAIRGRVMGIFTLILFGGNPIGSLVVGNSASFFTERIAVMANTVVLVLFAVFLWLRRPFIRKLE